MKICRMLALLFLPALLFSGACSPGDPAGLQHVNIAAVPTELNALAYIAEERGFFGKSGLDVSFREYSSGASAAAGMLEGEADMAFAAEFPLVMHILDGDDIVNSGTIAKYENTYIAWLTGGDIDDISDLTGRKIGVTMGTISQFYLGRILELNGVDIGDVKFLDVRASGAEAMLEDGEADAVVTWEPWAEYLRRNLGDEAVVRPIQSAQHAYWNLVSKREWAEANPDIIERLAGALAEAEEYLEKQTGSARSIVAKKMGFTGEYMERIWPKYHFALSLEQSMIIAMEDEARWMMDNDLTEKEAVPNFLEHIYSGGLKAVKPDSVMMPGK